MLDAKQVHIIGIGGIGTSAVAKWYLAQEAGVTGSDMAENQATKELKERGIQVSIAHQADGKIPEGTDLVIYSRAVPEDNAERTAARSAGITEVSFPQFLGMLAQRKKTIAISGTNGKSTTTAMIANQTFQMGICELEEETGLSLRHASIWQAFCIFGHALPSLRISKKTTSTITEI
jgi:UDP-N-acetylmuramate--alanine ligase